MEGQESQYHLVAIGGSTDSVSSIWAGLRKRVKSLVKNHDAEIHGERRGQRKHTFLPDTLKPYYSGSLSSLDSQPA